MTKFFVPFFAAAMLVAGAANAQKPAPAVKKVAPPVNKMPVPVARPVVPVTKPAPPVTKPAAAPVVAKPTPPPPPAPKPVPVAKPAPAPKPAVVAKPAPAPKPVAAPKPAVAAKPAAVKKAPVAKKAVAKKKTKVAKPAPVTEEVIAPKPVIRDEEPVRVVIREVEEMDTEKESDAPCSGKYHSINNCNCYKGGPDDCIPWKFRNRRYYRYNYTLEHYRNHKHDNCCEGNNSCGHSYKKHSRKCCH